MSVTMRAREQHIPLRSIRSILAAAVLAVPAFTGEAAADPTTRLRVQQFERVAKPFFEKGKAPAPNQRDEVILNLMRAKSHFDELAKSKSASPDEKSAAVVNAARASRQAGLMTDIAVRISGVNARKARDNQFPYQVALVLAGVGNASLGQFCGGSLYGKDLVLTAAHCFRPDTKPEDIQVFHGSTHLSSGGTLVNVSKIVRHEKYDRATNENDVAVLRLATAMQAEPLKLPGANGGDLWATGKMAIVSGWGDRVEGSGAGSDELMYAPVKVVAMDVCNGKESYEGRVKDGMLCAGDQDGDACQGDSGGPLVVTTPDGPTQIGVVSWGDGCARKFKYGVYTTVSTFRPWIDKALRPTVAASSRRSLNASRTVVSP